MKKLICCTLILVLILCFIGCNDQKNSDGSAKPQTTTTSAATTAKTTVLTTTQATTATTTATTTIATTTIATTDNNEPPTETGFYKSYLCLALNGEIKLYEKYRAYDEYNDPWTWNAILDEFSTETAIEGIIWCVCSFEEYPDLSYVLLASGTNIYQVYRLVE